MLHGGCHPLLSHNCDPLIDTMLWARQMWAGRYILVSEGNVEQTLKETGRWKRLDAGRNVETDVAIEDDW
jgi:hypothetical protein